MDPVPPCLTGFSEQYHSEALSRRLLIFTPLLQELARPFTNMFSPPSATRPAIQRLDGARSPRPWPGVAISPPRLPLRTQRINIQCLCLYSALFRRLRARQQQAEKILVSAFRTERTGAWHAAGMFFLSDATPPALPAPHLPPPCQSPIALCASVRPGTPVQSPNKDGVVLVVGATGGVGKRVVERLLAKGKPVRCLVRCPASHPPTIHPFGSLMH